MKKHGSVTAPNFFNIQYFLLLLILTLLTGELVASLLYVKDPICFPVSREVIKFLTKVPDFRRT